MTEDNPLIIIQGPEQSLVDPNLPDAGLPPAMGVKSWCVFRASRDVPEMTDGRGWTYHHHVDIASWRGRLYVGWNSCQRDEDVWPSRELYSTSLDGANWAPPQELFPQGISTALRMYFFLAPNGRMLAIAGLRTDQNDTDEDKKGGLVVREIREDHSLGDVHTLQVFSEREGRPPLFDRSSDAGFVAACRALLADRVFLEQQDRGRLLGLRRMKWHDASAWPGGKVPGDNEKWVAGKAFSFLNRPDGALIGVSKMGWTTISRDAGETWSQPDVPPSLVTGKAKVWSQRMADGRFALVYNPSRRNRFPLIVVTGEDGVHFRDMRIVQGELPIQRYEGLHRSIGPQYVRGISRWSDDRSRRDESAMWLVYSMNKEDIWVSRVPLSQAGESWNTYCPKWASIEEMDGVLRLESRDPFDDACAIHVFPDAHHARVSVDVMIKGDARDPMEIALHSKFGASIPAKHILRVDDTSLDRWTRIELSAVTSPDAPMNRVSFRTGPQRGIGGLKPVAPGADRPCEPRTLLIRNLAVK
jgi:hypothetical protein